MACVKSPVPLEDNGREKSDEGAVEEASLRVFEIVTSVGGWMEAQLEIALVDILEVVNVREGGTSDEEKDDIPLSIKGDEGPYY